ncbi:MAG: discoidin domain-containing protein [Blautia hansenii]|jgi:chemotaxis protein histidine kinase CheA
MAEPEEPTVHTEVMTETPEVLEAETVETLPEKALLEESQAHSELESVAETVSNEEEEENFFAEEDDEEEDEEDEKEKRNLTPEGKKARRRRILLAVLFLLLCLTAGIFLSLRKMKEMEQQEKEYYQQLDSAANTENTKQKEASEENTQKASEEPAAAEDKKETKKEEYFKLVSAEDVDFSKYKKIQPTSTEENSVKQSDSYDYSAKSAIDGDTASSWQENEDGSGEGKGIKLTLDGNHKIRYIVLYLGNWRSDELWDYNSRPKELTIQVGETQKKDVKFSDEKKKFCLSFDEPVDASFVSLYIKSVYEGSRWQDTCISEIELYE